MGSGAPPSATSTRPDGGIGSGAPPSATSTLADGGIGSGAPPSATSTLADGGIGSGAPPSATSTLADGGIGSGAPPSATSTLADGGIGSGAPPSAERTAVCMATPASKIAMPSTNRIFTKRIRPPQKDLVSERRVEPGGRPFTSGVRLEEIGRKYRQRATSGWYSNQNGKRRPEIWNGEAAAGKAMPAKCSNAIEMQERCGAKILRRAVRRARKGSFDRHDARPRFRGFCFEVLQHRGQVRRNDGIAGALASGVPLSLYLDSQRFIDA
jgi:hypothetical protein